MRQCNERGQTVLASADILWNVAQRGPHHGDVILSVERSGARHMKRETTALAVLFVWGVLGCATRPPKPYFVDGPGPHAFDCDAPPAYYRGLHIHPPGDRLKFTGVMQFVSVAGHPDPEWTSSISLVIGTQSTTSPPFAALVGRVSPDIPGKMLFTLKWGPNPSQQSGVFEVVATDEPIPFELTVDESYQLTASVGGAMKSVFVPPFKVGRASLNCSGLHVRYSNVVVSAQ